MESNVPDRAQITQEGNKFTHYPSFGAGCSLYDFSIQSNLNPFSINFHEILQELFEIFVKFG